MAAHLYWRLNIAANDGGVNYTQAAEIEMRTSVGGANVATGGTATASSVLTGSEASKAFDGNTTTTAWATASGQQRSWIQYQFASAVDIVEHAVWSLTSSNTNMIKNWSIQWSDDGSNWTTAAIVGGQTGWGVTEQRVFTHSSYPTAIGVGVLLSNVLPANTQAVPSATVNALLKGNSLGGKAYTGPYKTISGTVKQGGTPVARLVRGYHRKTNCVLGETTSDASTGAFSLDALGWTDNCYVVALDDLTASPDYNAQIYDLVIPV